MPGVLAPGKEERFAIYPQIFIITQIFVFNTIKKNYMKDFSIFQNLITASEKERKGEKRNLGKYLNIIFESNIIMT